VGQFYRSKDPANNSIKVLMKKRYTKENPEKANDTKDTYTYKIHNVARIADLAASQQISSN